MRGPDGLGDEAARPRHGGGRGRRPLWPSLSLTAAALGLAVALIATASGADPLAETFGETCLSGAADLAGLHAAMARRAGGGTGAQAERAGYQFGPFFGTVRSVRRDGSEAAMCMVTLMAQADEGHARALAAAEAQVAAAAGRGVARDCRGDPERADCRWRFEAGETCREVLAVVRKRRVVSLAAYLGPAPCGVAAAEAAPAADAGASPATDAVRAPVQGAVQ